MRRMLSSVLLAAAIILAAPASAGAVTYGLGDAPGTFAHCLTDGAACCVDAVAVCPAGRVTGYWDNPLFRELTSPASAHRITEARFFVPYDALQEWNGSTSSPACVFSRVLNQPWVDAAGRYHPASQGWDDLRASLIQAHVDGLTPLVTILGYPGPSARPAWDPEAPDPTTVGGWWTLHCGIQGILDAVSRLPAAVQPHLWEAFNEPEALAVYKGPGEIGPGACKAPAPPNARINGAAKAACVYALVAGQIHALPEHAADTVIAGTLSSPSLRYLADYARQLASLPPALYPTVWSVHDYGDVTRSFAGTNLGALAAFDRALLLDTHGRAAQLWVTEAGTLLLDSAPAPQCRPAAPPAPARAGTLGACVDGNAAAQAVAARAFFALPQAGTAVPITNLFWYQWQAEPHWDSALTDVAATPRVPWCTFYGSGTCDGNPSAPVVSPPPATG